MYLFTLLACGGAAEVDDHGHDHAKTEAHGHDHEAGHGHDEGHGHEAVVPLDAAEVVVAMGAHRGRLVPGEGHLELQVLGEDGAALPAVGEAKMVLTGTGQPAQRIVLKADGTSWKGEAKLEGAKGYLAVVSVPVAGGTQSGRFVWGEVPEAAPAPAPHEHDDHDEGGHDHGEHGHAH